MIKIVLIILFLNTAGFSKNILILNSYNLSFLWTQKQRQSIKQTLKNSKRFDNVYSEFMDTKRFRPTKQREKNLLTFYTNKYQDTLFDVVITTDDNALNFVKKYKSKQLFKNTKVFFCGVNNLSLKDKLDTDVYAGVFEEKDPIVNLKLAKRIDPKLDTVYLLSDNTITANKIIKEYKKAYKNIKDIDFIYLNNKHIEETLKSLKNYKKHSVMLILVFTSMYKNKKIISYEDAIKNITKIYPKPLLIHTNIYTKLPNVVGGYCVSGELQGKIAAQKALKYLNGTPMKDIGSTDKSPNQFYFNYKNIKKFNLDINQLNRSSNSVIINKPTSFYELYKNWMITGFVILGIIIIFLVVVMKKNIMIKKLNNKLINDIKEALEKNTKQLEVLQQQSKMAAMGEMIGAIAHQWRQPLNAINTSIQNLKYDYRDGYLNDEKFIIEFIDKNKETIKFMSKTIDDFRNFFRIDKEKKDFKILEATKAVAYMQLAQLKNYNIALNIEGKEFVYNGLQSEYQQVVLNLISNAKDALIDKDTKNKKTYNKSDSTSHQQNLNIDIILKDKTITIKDNAGGISDKIIDRIFEPYFTTKEQGKGTGIGLYIAKIIIEDNMSGTLKAYNDKNGAVFIIDFNKQPKKERRFK